MKRKKEIWDYIPYLMLFIITLMISISILMIITAYKIDDAATDYQSYAEQLYEENKDLKSELDKIKYQESRTRHCSLENVECGEEVEPLTADDQFEALVQATFRIETGNGTSQLWQTKNNPGGIICGNTYCNYETKEQGLNDLKTILKGYVTKYDYDLEAIRKVYCGSQCGVTDLKEFTKIYKEELKGKNK